MSSSRTRVLVETGVMIALAFALAHIKLYKLPQGGSITAASMVPILLIGMRHGLRWGVLGGVVLGAINYITDPFFVHPVQVLLDYPIAFGALGLAGLAMNRPWQASLLALGGRFVAHLVSGAVFFAEYAPQGQSPWVYSAIYNGSYLLPELIISGIALMLLLPALHRAMPESARGKGKSA